MNKRQGQIALSALVVKVVSLANSNFKLLPGAGIIHDTDFSTGSYWYRLLFSVSLNRSVTALAGETSMLVVITLVSLKPFSPGLSQSRIESDPVGPAGHCRLFAQWMDVTSVCAAETWSLRFPTLADWHSIGGTEISDRYRCWFDSKNPVVDLPYWTCGIVTDHLRFQHGLQSRKFCACTDPSRPLPSRSNRSLEPLRYLSRCILPWCFSVYRPMSFKSFLAAWRSLYFIAIYAVIHCPVLWFNNPLKNCRAKDFVQRVPVWRVAIPFSLCTIAVHSIDAMLRVPPHWKSCTNRFRPGFWQVFQALVLMIHA